MPKNSRPTSCPIFPIPREMKPTSGGPVRLDERAVIAVPEHPSAHDLALARFLVAEASDQFGLALRIERCAALPPDAAAIVMGAISNPLVRACCEKQGVDITAASPGPEGYVLHARKRLVLIAGSDEAGAFYGLQSLRQLLAREGTGPGVTVPGLSVRDWPHKPFRGVRLYVPGNENLAFFRRFLRDFMALYKFNKLILEVNACMRLDRHPEMNAASVEFAKDLTYRRCNYPEPRNNTSQNSTHYDAADGETIEKAHVAEILALANSLHMEVIPEIPSMTHSYYLLARHREVAEEPTHRWPDTYCPCNPKSYELAFDVMDEYIEVLKPATIHIGHDEWFLLDKFICPVCKKRKRPELFAEDVVRVHNHLAAHGIRVAMWGDQLMTEVRPDTALSAEQVRRVIPKDILVFNWFWHDKKTEQNEGGAEPGENKDLKVQALGFKQIYGNMTPEITNWARRSEFESVLGGSPSSWAATNEFNFGKDLLHDFLKCGNLLWSTQWPEKSELELILAGLTPGLRRRMRGATEPSEDGDAVTPLNIAPAMNAAPGDGAESAGALPSALAKGEVGAGRKRFRLTDTRQAGGKRAVVVGVEAKPGSPFPGEVLGIPVGRDVTSLVFLHACAKPAQWMRSYHEIYNMPDTSQLLGWYEVVYEDGFIETIPLRCGVNIRECGGQLLYGADTVDCRASAKQAPANFFAFEWRNPRLGRVIRSVNLKGASGHRVCRMWHGVWNETAPENAIILLGLSVVERRP
ncbi:MAG: hypothetical protein A3K19_02765 [Lentisphaerae bacterium RIFOXYB12_FULL_65_16]|nr:MAG: hypothetical protein A3K18_19815 [Lentisphaerae bacterium RIFOXYA12_64_32]OGV92274.1 MAG: hypothetical protein A3K19_02765 [Lentisphaerae bacterium RIFOXYB12_FULL_65_16]